MQKPIGTAVVGYGMSATVFHLPFLKLSPHFEIKAIVQRNGNEASTSFPGATIYRDFDDMLSDDQVQLVIITTPNATHYPFAAAALQAGKHVVLEKPFTNTASEALELISLARKNSRVLSVYHNRRYVSDFKTIVHLLQHGMLGKVHEYICHFDRYRPEPKPQAWREEPIAGSGILYDLGSHLIDQALCLFGLPQSITAVLKNQRPHARIDDYFDIRIDFGDCSAILKSSMLIREMGHRYQVHGDMGSYLKSGDDPQEEMLKRGSSPNSGDWGREPEHMKGLLHTFFNGHMMQEHISSLPGNFGEYYDNLYKTIVHGSPLKEKPEHGYNTIALIELAIQSARERTTIPCHNLLDASYPFDLPIH